MVDVTYTISEEYDGIPDDEYPRCLMSRELREGYHIVGYNDGADPEGQNYICGDGIGAGPLWDAGPATWPEDWGDCKFEMTRDFWIIWQFKIQYNP